MTIVHACTIAKPGDTLQREDSKRTFIVGSSKKPQLLVDHYGQAAAFFTDDLTADDWEVIKRGWTP